MDAITLSNRGPLAELTDASRLVSAFLAGRSERDRGSMRASLEGLLMGTVLLLLLSPLVGVAAEWKQGNPAMTPAVPLLDHEIAGPPKGESPL